MKLFENAKLDRISTALCMNTADCKIRGRYDTGGGRIWGCVDSMTQGEGGYGDV